MFEKRPFVAFHTGSTRIIVSGVKKKAFSVPLINKRPDGDPGRDRFGWAVFINCRLDRPASNSCCHNTTVHHCESASISADAIGLLVGSRVAGWGAFVK